MFHWRKILPVLLLFSLDLFSIHSESIEIPVITNPGLVVRRNHYTLQYNEKYEQADWVAYELTRTEVFGQTSRQDSFKTDPKVSTGSATLEDYRGSGYDRGHLAPAADMKMSAGSMADSFFMSNMSPQDPSFNRGSWSKLESIVRTWAYNNQSVFIVTGPIFNNDVYPVIGESKVAVPEYYYKVILDYTEPEIKAIGFILPNKKGERGLESYARSIDEVERITGIDFFHLLPDSIESKVESSFSTALWSFQSFPSQQSRDLDENSNVSHTSSFWINSSSMTRHNSSCRYYDNTKNGYYSSTAVGKACRICDG